MLKITQYSTYTCIEFINCSKILYIHTIIFYIYIYIVKNCYKITLN